MITYSNEEIKKFFVMPHIWLCRYKSCHVPNTQSKRFILMHLYEVKTQQALRTQIIDAFSKVIALGSYRLTP